MHLRMSSVRWRPFRLGLNVLKHDGLFHTRRTNTLTMTNQPGGGEGPSVLLSYLPAYISIMVANSYTPNTILPMCYKDLYNHTYTKTFILPRISKNLLVLGKNVTNQSRSPQLVKIRDYDVMHTIWTQENFDGIFSHSRSVIIVGFKYYDSYTTPICKFELPNYSMCENGGVNP